MVAESALDVGDQPGVEHQGCGGVPQSEPADPRPLQAGRWCDDFVEDGAAEILPGGVWVTVLVVNRNASRCPLGQSVVMSAAHHRVSAGMVSQSRSAPV